ncbi:MAG: hypothetical protein WCL50_01390, partial [Spirochaetota bacterium]
VFDEETGRGVAGVIVSLDGITALTDGKGDYRFPAVKVGRPALKVSTSRLEIPLTVKRDTPATVEVLSMRESTLDIALTRPCLVRGQVAQYGQKKSLDPKKPEVGDADLVKGAGLGYLLCELSGESETRRALTNARGEFEFSALDPGTWKLKIYEKNLPSALYFEKAAYEFELAPGQSAVIEVRALERMRNIQMIDEGEVIELE